MKCNALSTLGSNPRKARERVYQFLDGSGVQLRPFRGCGSRRARESHAPHSTCQRPHCVGLKLARLFDRLVYGCSDGVAQHLEIVSVGLAVEYISGYLDTHYPHVAGCNDLDGPSTGSPLDLDVGDLLLCLLHVGGHLLSLLHHLLKVFHRSSTTSAPNPSLTISIGSRSSGRASARSSGSSSDEDCASPPWVANARCGRMPSEA